MPSQSKSKKIHQKQVFTHKPNFFNNSLAEVLLKAPPLSYGLHGYFWSGQWVLRFIRVWHFENCGLPSDGTLISTRSLDDYLEAAKWFIQAKREAADGRHVAGQGPKDTECEPGRRTLQRAVNARKS